MLFYSHDVSSSNVVVRNPVSVRALRGFVLCAESQRTTTVWIGSNRGKWETRDLVGEFRIMEMDRKSKQYVLVN